MQTIRATNKVTSMDPAGGCMKRTTLSNRQSVMVCRAEKKKWEATFESFWCKPCCLADLLQLRSNLLQSGGTDVTKKLLIIYKHEIYNKGLFLEIFEALEFLFLALELGFFAVVALFSLLLGSDQCQICHSSVHKNTSTT